MPRVAVANSEWVVVAPKQDVVAGLEADFAEFPIGRR